jgi:hypothetical protein
MAKKKEIFTGANVISAIAASIGIKKSIVKDVLLNLGHIISHQLNTVGVIKVPYLCKITKVVKLGKTRPAGVYPNFFKKDAEGKPLMEKREAKVIPTKTKMKFSFLKNMKDALK